MLTELIKNFLWKATGYLGRDGTLVTKFLTKFYGVAVGNFPRLFWL